jgi:hypothetical protein
MESSSSRTWSARAVAAGVGLVLLMSLMTSGRASAVPVENCGGLEIMPVDEIRKDMVGTGLTVTKGRQPETFSAKVLGVLPDAILPGRDLIIAEVSSNATIDRLGGIWFGISGSPVYVDNKLIGAVSFGLSFSPSRIVGLTPAEDMVKVLGFPSGSKPTTSARSSARFPLKKIAIPDPMVRRISRATGLPEDGVDNGFQTLKIPFAVSGVSARGLARIQEVVRAEGLPLLPYAGTSSSAAAVTSTDPLNPGDNFAATISFGDITQAGIGTTTFVCEGAAMAFGHPFFLAGKILFGANHADAITIVEDQFFGGGFKLATVEEAVGTVDQDRFAGIRADLSRMPVLIPVTSSINALNTGSSRDGTTQVVDSEFVPFTSFIHLFASIDSTFDQISKGSSALSWTITGTRETGEPWQLDRSNLYASDFDISFESSFELLGQLFTILENDFETIEFTGVDMDATVEEELKRFTIEKVRVSLNGGRFLDKRRIRVSRGDIVGLRVVLLPEDGSEKRIVDLEVRVPRRVRTNGIVEITGGSNAGSNFECFFFGEGCEGNNKAQSFDELLDKLANAPKNSDLIARLRMGPRLRLRSRDIEALEQVVAGRKRVRLILIGGSGGTFETAPSKG